jgi:hypothetical protein
MASDASCCASCISHIVEEALRTDAHASSVERAVAGEHTCNASLDTASTGFPYIGSDVRGVEYLCHAMQAGGDPLEAMCAAWDLLHAGHWCHADPQVRALHSAATAKAVDNALTSSGGTQLDLAAAMRLVDVGLLLAGEERTALQNVLLHLKSQDNKGAESVLPTPTLPSTYVEGSAPCPQYAEQTGPLPPVLHQPSVSTFNTIAFMPSHPVLLKDCMSHWPALASPDTGWHDLSFLLINGRKDRTVPVELGRDYMSTEWRSTLLSLESFVTACRRMDAENRMHSSVQTHVSPASPDSTANTSISDTSRVYLAQHTLLEQIPELKADILIPDYCCLSPPTRQDQVDESRVDDEPAIHVWIGPGGTVSCLHFDSYSNIFAQVVGYKRIRLYNPSHTHMYARSGLVFNTSQVDAENIDTSTFPDFPSSPDYDIIVGPGDMLFIPFGWWHHVRAMSTSVSVSFWW